MGKVIVNVRPFRVPGFVIPVGAKIFGQSTKDVSFPVSVMDADVLSDMCDQFRADVFEKAGKKDPKPTNGRMNTDHTIPPLRTVGGNTKDAKLTMEIEKLKPCPFCGSKPRKELGKVYRDQMHGERQQDHVIRCPSHCVRMEHCNEQVLIKKWNTRPAEVDVQDVNVEGLIEKLEKAANTGGWYTDGSVDIAEIERIIRNHFKQGE